MVFINIYGSTHADRIGARVEGLPEDFKLDKEKLQGFLNRRKPTADLYSTQRREDDKVEITEETGAIEGVIYNKDAHKHEHSSYLTTPRPGHGDYTSAITGRPIPSGRMTAPLCIAGGILLQILEQKGITVHAEVAETGDIAAAAESGDSVGGIVKCVIEGVPAGVGEPDFNGVENIIAKRVFAVPAVKGIEFGAGFAAASMFGSENNDEFYYDENGKVKTYTNNCGGILGGITNGMPIVFRVAFKPVPSIAKEQKTVNLETGENDTVKVQGRNDVCFVPRTPPAVEAAAAIAIYELMFDETEIRRE